MALNQTLNTAELMTGKDGYLMVEVNGVNVPLLEVETFSVIMNFTVSEKQFVGNPVINRIPTGVSFDLTFTEAVVRDDTFVAPILEALRAGKFPSYSFQGVTEKPDGQEQRVAYNSVVPNGSLGLQTLTPGEVISREMAFAINEVPQMISSLASTYLQKL
jgi:hypothetical protein